MNYDIIIIGGGPGGYVSAIRAAQLGFKVGCIDKWIDKNNNPSLGGTCLNVGCIPSKALLESSHLFKNIQNSEHLGIKANAKIDVKKMLANKDKIVGELTGGIASLFKANNITWLQGTGKLLKNKQVSFIDGKNNEEILTAKNIVLATGSVSVIPPNMKLGKRVIDSEGALDLDKIPKKLCVIGAGAIGLELGSVWRRLGSEVVILERDGFLTTADSKVSRTSASYFKKQGLSIFTGAEVISVSETSKFATVKYKKAQEEITEKFDNVIVAVGRKPYLEGCIDKDSGVKINDSGRVEVDDFCQTSVEGVYAIGDIVKGPMLAHKASEEGVVVAQRIAGQKSQINHDLVPMVIYTHPEIAWVGKTEKDLKTSGVDYKVGEFSFMANGRAKSASETDGFVKVLADSNTDRILGMHIVGHNASELIANGVITMEFEGTSEDLSRMIFAHPTLSESIHEAALAVDKRAIHTINKK